MVGDEGYDRSIACMACVADGSIASGCDVIAWMDGWMDCHMDV